MIVYSAYPRLPNKPEIPSKYFTIWLGKGQNWVVLDSRTEINPLKTKIKHASKDLKGTKHPNKGKISRKLVSREEPLSSPLEFPLLVDYYIAEAISYTLFLWGG